MYFLSPIIYHLSPRQSGQAALTTVLLVGGVVLFVGITMTLLVVALLNGGAAYQFGIRAYTIAQGGIEDALLRLDRDRNFASVYTVPQNGSPAANVSVVQNSPSAERIRILSTASVNGYTKSLEAIVSVVSSTGEMNVLSWNSL